MIFRIFASGSEQADIARKYKVIEAYEGFIIVEISKDESEEITKKYLSEDITTQYEINLPHIGSNGKTVKLADISKQSAGPFPKGLHHYLVQFIGPIKKQWLAAVKKNGAELREAYGGFTYIIKADEKNIQKVINLPYVRWAGHLPYQARIDSGLLKLSTRPGTDIRKLPRTKQLPGIYTVEFFRPADVEKAVAPVRKLGFNILEKNARGKVLIVTSKKDIAKGLKDIDKLSKVHGVRRIGERSINRPSNDVAAGILGTTRSMSVSKSTSLALSGKNEIIAVCDTGLDTGDPLFINEDFTGRIEAIKSYPITSDYDKYINNPGGNDGAADLDEGHGTHVAGSILGNGTNSVGIAGLKGLVRGLAYNARLVFQAVEQEMKWKSPKDLKNNGRYLLAGIPVDLTELFAYAYQKGARIHSNSWGGGNPGEYDEQCRQLDQFVWTHKDFCIFVAAGNDGTDKDGDGKINPMSVTSPGTAKNCITIGACENLRPNFAGEVYGDWWPDDYPVNPFKNDPMADDPTQVVAFSSRGPTKDNRFKPDIISPGTFILSVRSSMIAANNTAWAPLPQSKKYFYMGGTSMATPLSAGATALVREYLRTKKNIASPSAALLKAALVAGAIKLPGMQSGSAVVDNNQGYGRLNLDNILSPAKPAKLVFIDNSKGLDTGALYTITISLKSNKVSLRVVMAYSDYPGESLINNLNLVLTSPSGKKYSGNQYLDGTLTLDSLNNVEAIQVDKPDAGLWKIDVIASNVPQGPQDFALVYMAHM